MTEPHQFDSKPTASATQLVRSAEEQRLHTLTHILYALYALSYLTAGMSALAAIIINYIKREDTAGTLYASHFTWQIRTFWWSLAWGILGFVLAIVAVGFIVMWVSAIWMLYRIVKGWLYLYDTKPMPTSGSV